MRIRFQADANLNEDIVTGVLRRESQIDFQRASEAGLNSLADDQVLALAAHQDRIIVTHDRKTMPKHFALFIQNRSSPGLLVVSQKMDLLPVIDELVLIWLLLRRRSGSTASPPSLYGTCRRLP